MDFADDAELEPLAELVSPSGAVLAESTRLVATDSARLPHSETSAANIGLELHADLDEAGRHVVRFSCESDTYEIELFVSVLGELSAERLPPAKLRRAMHAMISLPSVVVDSPSVAVL